ncbi:RNA-directed DNA polymerase, eukaryota [Tanacetum coccineum]
MFSHRSNEDHVAKISKSIFVTNFPDNFGSRNLGKICENYGKVVDVYIPNRKSKVGKRFAFVHFVRVEDIDRLVGNLYNIWIGRLHLHANVVRFERARKPYNSKGFAHTNVHAPSGPYATADEVQDFVRDEHVVWVDIEGIRLNVWSRETILKIGKKWGETMDIEDNLDSSFAQKRLCIKTKQADNILEKFKVIFKGKVFMARAKELFAWTPIFLEHKKSLYTSDDESLQADDPFSIYDVLKRHPTSGARDSSSSFSHLPCFTPEELETRKENSHVEAAINNEVEKVPTPLVNAKVMNNSQEVQENVDVMNNSNGESAYQNDHNVHSGGFILGLMEDMIRVGQSMGYTMEWCMKDIEHIIGTQGVDDVPK